MNAEYFGLDYFQIYEIENPVNIALTRPVLLKGQFERDRPPVPARPMRLARFADRASKNDEPIFDRLAHFTWYDLAPLDAGRVGKVRVHNQFFEQGHEVCIEAAIGLLVPAQKRIPPRTRFSALTRLSHFKIYGVGKEEQIGQRTFKLEDQFARRETALLKPFALAVPVLKVYRTEFPIVQNRPFQAHLMIYEVKDSEDLPVVIDIRDQLRPRGVRNLKLGVSKLLAVPSKKEWLSGG